MLARCKAEFPVIIAGNRSVSRECADLLAGKEVYRCENVLPELGKLNIEPSQKQIRELFLRRIIQAKGLSKASQLISGIMMPTPGAVLEAMKLLADGTKLEPGLGELVCVDLGGATTDVYSVAKGSPTHASTVLKGLPEPYAKRTVEGDIGMRYSIRGILDAEGIERITQLSGLSEDKALELSDYLSANTNVLPDTPEIVSLDFALAAVAVETAVSRHSGTLESVYTQLGEAFMQVGKDLRPVEKIIATGGALIHSGKGREIVSRALYNPAQPMSLRPKDAKILVDKRYIMAAMGLLGAHYPETALRIMKKELM
jgi:uncharacterized protein (TIGR01319 family)